MFINKKFTYKQKDSLRKWIFIFFISIIGGVGGVLGVKTANYMGNNKDKIRVTSETKEELQFPLASINDFIKGNNDRSFYIYCFHYFSGYKCTVSISYIENKLEVKFKKRGSSLEEAIYEADKFIKENF